MTNLPPVILSLSFLSFCMSFSGSFITFVKTKDALSFSIEQYAILRSFGDFLGYISRIIVGILIDKYRKRKPFLIIGYAPVIVLKFMMLLVFIPYFNLTTRKYLFIISDLLDITLNSARDIARDCYISDISINHDTKLNQALSVRKSISLLGTTSGLIVFSTYFYFYNKMTSFITLSAIAMIVATIGVVVLLYYVKESDQNLLKTSQTTINISSIFHIKMWPGFIAVFLLAFTKFNHFALFRYSEMLIREHYTYLIRYLLFISTLLLPSLYYFCGSIISIVLSNFSFITNFTVFAIISAIITLLHFMYIINLSSLFVLIALIVLYGFYNSMMDVIISNIILRSAQKNNIMARGTILATINIIMALANLLFSTILSRQNITIFALTKNTFIINLLGVALLGYVLYENK